LTGEGIVGGRRHDLGSHRGDVGDHDLDLHGGFLPKRLDLSELRPARLPHGRPDLPLSARQYRVDVWVVDEDQLVITGNGFR
jgi:hypothetical protein